jgi:hypothetical protein
MLGAIRWATGGFRSTRVLGVGPGVRRQAGERRRGSFHPGRQNLVFSPGLTFTRLYLPTVTLTGGVDLLSVTPSMLRYEAVITNVFTGLGVVRVRAGAGAGSVGRYPAADACDAERRAARYRTPSASVCSSCIVPAGTLQESPGP